MPDVFDGIYGQARVRQFLRSAISSERISHAYLFIGPAGTNKAMAARAFSQALICEHGGCGTCEACRRVARDVHPDVHALEPEGASGYLIEQIRLLEEDVPLAPVQAERKVYILDCADRLTAASANAILKTLEEPPESVMFILLGRTCESILPTIVSRCQVVPFRHIPPSEAVAIITQNAGVSPIRARSSLVACDGSISRAIAFSRSNERQTFRIQVFDALSSLEHADSWGVIKQAKALVVASKAALDAVRVVQERDLAEKQEFIQGSARKNIELKNKRALVSLEKENLAQLFALTESWLHDLLVISTDACELVVNEDVLSVLSSTALRCSTCGIVAALRTAAEYSRLIAYNVSPQACIEALLLDVKKDLYG